MWGYGHMYVMRGSGFSLFGLLPFIILIGFILLIWAIAAHRRNNDDMSDKEEQCNREETALDILKKRYASGDITKREFVEMKKDIS
jgi:uncharacterized membrane protein